MANENEWKVLGNQTSQGTASTANESGGEWKVLSAKPQLPSSVKPETQSVARYLLGRTTRGLGTLGSAGAASTSLGPGAIFATNPIEPEELMLTPEQIQQRLGIEPARSEGQGALTRYLGTGLEAVGDPLSYAFGPGGLGLKAAGALTAGAGAEAGGDVGGALEAGFRGEESGVGRFIGQLGGSLAGTFAQGGLRYGTEVTGDVFAQLRDKFSKIKVDPSEAESLLAADAAKRFLEEGAKAGGKDYSQMIEDFREVSQFVLGTDAPLMLQAADNPVFKEELVRLAKTDPLKKAQLEAELKRIAQAIDTRSARLFGERYREIPASAPLDIRNVRRRINEIDRRIQQLSDPFLIPEDRTDLGKAVQNLIETRERLVRRELAPRYEELRQTARAEGVKLSPEAAQTLHLYVKQNRILDIFGRQTDPEKQVSSILSPREVEGVDIMRAERTTRQEYPEMSFDNIDSLKRLVNDQLRRVKDPVQLKKLEDFKNLLNDVRDKYVPAEYNDALKALDREYYERIGIPFNERGIQEISAKAYADQVASTLLKNRESLEDFLDVAGDQGREIAQKAMVSLAYQSVIKDGLVSDTALRAFIKKHETVLAAMPEVRDMLTNTRVADQQLRASRANLERAYQEAQKRIADNWFSGTQREVPSMTQLVDNAFKNPNARSKLLRDISDLSPESAAAVRESLRAEVVNKARNNPSGGVAFLTDPKNKATLDVLLGRGYQENLKKVLTLADAVQKADIQSLGLSVDLQKNLDPLNRLFPGLDVQGTVATLRRPIVSGFQKGVILYSKISQARAQQAFDNTIFDALTDPAAVKRLAQTADRLDLQINNPTTLRQALSAGVEAIPARIYIGLTAPEERQQPQPIEEKDALMLQRYMSTRTAPQ